MLQIFLAIYEYVASFFTKTLSHLNLIFTVLILYRITLNYPLLVGIQLCTLYFCQLLDQSVGYV